ncbi:DUF2937 family protein [Aestuariibacter salexigens]|uniref:DUF2937 family protein n=1 Tax=Aestuariibacter salexigens TaxID=226010 RepID=UPI00047EB60C|nr:DUF2937 family protein [Aestuariibacter salexigens]
MFRHYLRLMIFGAGLLGGIQVPGFIDQYVKRVDAQWRESQQNLSGFQDTADRYFDGSLLRLIAHYRSSKDRVFVSDADNIENIMLRNQRLKTHLTQLDAPLVTQIWVIASNADVDILQRTREVYSYVVLLTPEAVAVGLIMALLFAVLGDGSIWIMKIAITGRRKRSPMIR